MTTDAPVPSWRDRVREIDPDAHDKMVDYIGHITGRPDIPEKYVELIVFAASTAVRYRTSMLSHARRALAAGATREEIFQAGALAALSAGFTALIEVVAVLEELDPD